LKRISPLVEQSVQDDPGSDVVTGQTASVDQAQEAHRFIRSQVAQLLGSALAGGMRILYGGSVKPENISALMAMADIDGALVGGASLQPDSFSRIVKFN